MKAFVRKIDPRAPQAEVIQEACARLREGLAVAFPTDTLYALGADALNPEAIERVYAAKGRSAGKAVSLLVAGQEMAAAAAREIPASAAALMARFWPGALTIVLPASERLPEALIVGRGTVGLRMPRSAVALALLGGLGHPITGTSANRSGGPDPLEAAAVQKALGRHVALILDGGRVPFGIPSTVVDCTATPPKILREGAVPAAQVLSAFA